MLRGSGAAEKLQRCLNGKRGRQAAAIKQPLLRLGLPPPLPQRRSRDEQLGVTDPLNTSKQDGVLQVITGHNLPIFATVELFGKSAFPKVGELVPRGLLPCWALRLCVRQVPALRVLQRDPSPSCSLHGDAAHTRLGAMYLD